jgi:hypothetical protein
MSTNQPASGGGHNGCGALMMTSASRVVRISADHLDLANGLVYRRGPIPFGVPVWNFGRRQHEPSV